MEEIDAKKLFLETFAACKTPKTFGFGAQIVDLQASFCGRRNVAFEN